MEIEAGQYLALVKFFREKEHLDMFIDGHLYCNTPEYYRLSNAPGISDRNESCHLSFRGARGDSPLSVEVEGKALGKATDMIIRSGRKEGWLHCWAIIEAPKTDDEFNCLVADFKRMQNEFGPYYVFVDPESSHLVAERIASSIGVSVEAKEVTYLEHTILGESIYTKGLPFSYQREFRFVFSECGVKDINSRTFTIKQGFSDLVKINPKFELVARTEEEELSFVLENS